VIIATPSAQHASQAITAFGHGLSAFVQKPLARTAEETRTVIEAARAANRSLGVDFSYRGVQGMCTARRLIAEGAIGEPFAVELMFHNAYGPDKAWFYDRPQSGGGCLMDLGCHLVDLLLWLCPNDQVLTVHAQRYASGARLAQWDTQCEDFALATMTTSAGVTARLACSWRAHAGQDAVIGATVYGTRGGVQLVNVDGSFTHFQVSHLTGTQRVLLADSNENWDGKEIRHWAQRLARGEGFCAERSAQYLAVADVMDRLYEH
jgi:predicted dehydrogenase